MGRLESPTFIFLTARAFTGKKVGPSALDAGAFDWLVDVEADVFFGGKLDSFLIMIDAKLRMMIFATTVNQHHGTSIASLDVMNMIGSIIIIGGFKLFFVIINKTNGFVMTD